MIELAAEEVGWTEEASERVRTDKSQGRFSMAFLHLLGKIVCADGFDPDSGVGQEETPTYRGL